MNNVILLDLFDVSDPVSMMILGTIIFILVMVFGAVFFWLNSKQGY